MKRTHKYNTLLTAGLALGALGSLSAQDAAPAAEGNLFTSDIPAAFKDGKISFNARLRYENVDQTGLMDANALLIRPRLGFTTAPLNGFQAMVEMENITAIGTKDDYNAAGANPGGAGRAVIADPETTELNQAWLSYSNWDSSIKLGRQVIIKDNVRWVGDVGWRMNNQTFDSVTFENKSIDKLSFAYGYIWNVNRVFGGQSPAAANRDFTSDTHLFNVDYTGLSIGKLGAYAYLVDLDNPASTSANDSASYGISLSGSYAITDTIKPVYRAEFAWQTDYADKPAAGDFSAPYYNLEVKLPIKPVTIGVGYEVLGSDNGRGVSMPLATLHAFNGWADQFLATPAGGIEDIYAIFGVSLPYGINATAIYHELQADKGGLDYGNEIDLVLTKNFGKNWSALLKFASFDGKDAPFARDVKKFWAQVEFKY